MDYLEVVFSLKSVIANNDTETFALVIRHAHPADIAAAIAKLNLEQQCRLLKLAEPAKRAEIFGYLSAELQVRIANAIGRKPLVELFLHMSADERADLYNDLPEDQRDTVLPALAQIEREDIRRLAAYPEDQVGSVMTSDYATLAPDLTAAAAIEELRRIAPDTETIYQAFVIDRNRRLIGTVSLRELIIAHAQSRIGDIMKPSPVAIKADAPREEAVQLISKYDLLALPVINGGDMLVGIVTYDDALDVEQQETSEDFHKVASVGALGKSLREASVWLLFRKRVFWLLLLVFGNLFSGAGIAFFEDTIAAYIALVFFLPLLIDSGGNAGSQAATLMVRALATGEIVLRDWAGMLLRELFVATLLGLSMAVAVSSLGLWRGGPEIAVVVAVSMQVIVITGSVIGMSLPFLLSKFKLDPATASAPLITSIADALGVIIYFTIATTMLDMSVLEMGV
ncbi:MAG: magnesium transporter [Chromatiaceae bacterium]|nr:MAG: magnesium transporter [Chromatiaceae bacterium]